MAGMRPSLEATVHQESHRITRAVEALCADHERHVHLTDDQVVRAVHKRGIAGEGHLRVLAALLVFTLCRSRLSDGRSA